MKKRIFIFITALVIWIIFSARISTDVIFVGIVAALLTTVFFGDMFVNVLSKDIPLVMYPVKFITIIFFIPVFFYEALTAAIEVSRHIFEKEPTFSPGIVKVKTKLTNLTAITVLANLITLTPGTLTLDFDKTEGVYYIHWIDVKTREEIATRKEIIERFEHWLGVIFK